MIFQVIPFFCCAVAGRMQQPMLSRLGAVWWKHHDPWGETTSVTLG